MSARNSPRWPPEFSASCTKCKAPPHPLRLMEDYELPPKKPLRRVALILAAAREVTLGDGVAAAEIKGRVTKDGKGTSSTEYAFIGGSPYSFCIFLLPCHILCPILSNSFFGRGVIEIGVKSVACTDTKARLGRLPKFLHCSITHIYLGVNPLN